MLAAIEHASILRALPWRFPLLPRKCAVGHISSKPSLNAQQIKLIFKTDCNRTTRTMSTGNHTLERGVITAAVDLTVYDDVHTPSRANGATATTFPVDHHPLDIKPEEDNRAAIEDNGCSKDGYRHEDQDEDCDDTDLDLDGIFTSVGLELRGRGNDPTSVETPTNATVNPRISTKSAALSTASVRMTITPPRTNALAVSQTATATIPAGTASTTPKGTLVTPAGAAKTDAKTQVDAKAPTTPSIKPVRKKWIERLKKVIRRLRSSR